MHTVISVENLSKTYRLGQIGTGTFSHDLNVWWAKMRGKPNPLLRIGEKDHGNRDGEDLWALRDISFTLEQGEVLGIIGRNGAGKSTLLKILSRVTVPTAGRVKIKGRVASLLEVGTGFHPELTGRENIYLNSAILGMSNREVERKFDEIVDFAEVEKFIDTPVKRYSSGMYVRLAFAVSAYLEPEILVVDEVLAVGDAKFQNKCLGKMGEFSQEGRTVIFISHNMQMILRLCQRALLLDKGNLIADGSVHRVTQHYLRSGIGVTSWREWSLIDAPGNEIARLLSVRVLDETRIKKEEISIASAIDVAIEYEILEKTIGIAVQVGFFNLDGLCLFISQDVNNPNWRERTREKGFLRSTVHVPAHFFSEGHISLNVMVVTVEPTYVHVHVQDVVSFTIVDYTNGTGVRGNYAKEWPGVLRPLLEWSIEPYNQPD